MEFGKTNGVTRKPIKETDQHYIPHYYDKDYTAKPVVELDRDHFEKLMKGCLGDYWTIEYAAVVPSESEFVQRGFTQRIHWLPIFYMMNKTGNGAAFLELDYSWQKVTDVEEKDFEGNPIIFSSPRLSINIYGTDPLTEDQLKDPTVGWHTFSRQTPHNIFNLVFAGEQSKFHNCAFRSVKRVAPPCCCGRRTFNCKSFGENLLLDLKAKPVVTPKGKICTCGWLTYLTCRCKCQRGKKSSDEDDLEGR